MKNKVILIVGATSMIGSACAHLFAQQGMKLMLVGRDPLKLKTLARELMGDINYSVADLDRPDDVKTFVDKTVAGEDSHIQKI